MIRQLQTSGKQHPLKGLIPIAAILLALLAPLTRAYAATYVDEMTESDGGNFKQYYNLTRFPIDSASALPDKSAFGFASVSSPSGWVDYRLQNARTITVGLYSQGGTYAGASGNGAHILGATGENSALPGQNAVQALCSPSSGGVYTTVQGALHKAAFDDIRYVFVPTAETPADLTGYGVNIYTSSGGSSYTRLTPSYTRTSHTAGGAFFYEELTAPVPSGVTHIRVELNDVGQFPLLNKPGQVIYKTAKRYNLLASVTITGENLVYGIPEPVVEVAPVQPQPSAEEPEPSAASSKGSSGSSASAKATVTVRSASSAAGGSEPASPAGSKFEGVIVSSAPASRASAARPSSAVSAAPKQQAAPEPAQAASASPAPGPVVYQVAGGVDEEDGFTRGVILYIAAVGAALLLILLRPGKKKQ